jgi:hypothetical protein
VSEVCVPNAKAIPVARLAGLRRPSTDDDAALYGSSFDASGAGGGECGPSSSLKGSLSGSLSGSAANRAPRARVVHDAVRASVVGFGAPAAPTPGGRPAGSAKPASGRSSSGLLRRELQSGDTVLGTPNGEPLVVCEPAVRKPGTGRSQARRALWAPCRPSLRREFAR